MAFSREIFQFIKQNIPFQRADNEKDSHYTVLGNTLVRISDHCTWMYVWDNFLEKNPKWKGKPIVSIVFEDTGDTFTEDCLLLKRFRRNPIKVNEFVYPLHGNAQYLSKQDVQSIIKGLKGLLNSTEFVDPTGKGKHEFRVSKNPPDNTINNNQTQNQENNQQTNENKTMNKKQVIRLNESQLRQIVSETVRKVLNETYIYDTPTYYWTISRQNEEEETLECLYGAYTPGMENPKSFDENGFTSPNTAFKYGMKFLKDNFDEFNEGYYCLEVVDEKTGDIIRYTTIKNGKVQHKF